MLAYTNFDEIAHIMRGKTISENTLDEELDDLEVNEDLERF